jgi:hypothetical protein
MKHSDRISGILLFAFALFIFIKSFQYPGAGLFPLLASILLMSLSGTILISLLLNKGEKAEIEAAFFPSKEYSAFKEWLIDVLAAKTGTIVG